MRLSRYVIAVGALLATLLSTPANAQSVTKLRFQSVFPPSGYLFENSKYFADRVKAMSGGRLLIDILPPGAVVAYILAPGESLPASAAPFLKEPDGKAPLIVATSLPATAYGDIASWREAVTVFEREWCSPLLAALNDGALQSLTLHGLGPDYGYTVAVTRRDLLRFWRRRRPLREYASE